MKEHPHIMIERIDYELRALAEPNSRKLPYTYFMLLVGKKLADEASHEYGLAAQWKRKVMPFVDDPMMTPAQSRLWERIKPDWQAAIEQSRKAKPVRTKFKAAFDNLVSHMMSIDALNEEERRLFLDDGLPDRMISEVGWHPRLVVQTFRKAIIEPDWIREAPIRQQRAALRKALDGRLTARRAVVEQAAQKSATGTPEGEQ